MQAFSIHSPSRGSDSRLFLASRPIFYFGYRVAALDNAFQLIQQLSGTCFFAGQ